MKILYIGNSFTGRNDLPGLITAMAASASEPISIEHQSILANGASLRQHWNAGNALQKICDESWDFIVLQEQSPLPIKNAARYHENVRLFNSEIENTGARTALYLTWARQAVPETQAVLSEATLEIAREIEAFVVPVGLVWQELLKNGKGIDLYDKDGSHPSAAGSYLAACVFCKALLKREPLGLAVPTWLKLSPAEAEYLQAFVTNSAVC
jgi:hypothetical protein